MTRRELIHEKNLIVNINHSVSSVLKLHKNDISAIYITEVPSKMGQLCKCVDIYGGIYEQLVVDVFQVSDQSGKTLNGLAMIAFMDDTLKEMTSVDIEPDTLIFVSGEHIVEIFTEHVHYICNPAKKEMDSLQKFIDLNN